MEKARRRREAARKRNLRIRHHMTVEQYDDLLAFQGGVCAQCRRARGVSRKLAVDHDHTVARELCDHPHEESCESCWRGLLCSTCNDMFGHGRDDIEFFRNAAWYLKDPPARRWLVSRDD